MGTFRPEVFLFFNPYNACYLGDLDKRVYRIITSAILERPMLNKPVKAICLIVVTVQRGRNCYKRRGDFTNICHQPEAGIRGQKHHLDLNKPSNK